MTLGDGCVSTHDRLIVRTVKNASVHLYTNPWASGEIWFEKRGLLQYDETWQWEGGMLVNRTNVVLLPYHVVVLGFANIGEGLGAREVEIS